MTASRSLDELLALHEDPYYRLSAREIEELVVHTNALRAQLAAVQDLIKPQWRTIPSDIPVPSVDSFREGRNWMIDRIRAVLSEENP